MSTRFEFIDAASASVESWTWQQVYEETDEKLPDDQRGLIIGGDEVTVVAGTLAELRAFAERITRALDAAEPALPELPAPAETDAEVEVTCPHVFTAEEVAAEEQARVEYIARMREMHGDAAKLYPPAVHTVGEVCGADLLLWESEPQRRYLYVQGGRWIAGPSKWGDAGVDDAEVNCSSTAMHYWAVPEIDDWQ